MKFASNGLLATLALSTCLGTGLIACAPLVVGGMAVGTMVAIDRRTTGAQVEDQGIELHASSRVGERLGDRGHVNITSFNRQVLLTGEVPSEADKQMVEQVVAKVENVRTTVNEIAVMTNTGMSQRSSDSLITGRVKAGLVDAKDIFAVAFKVVTERGTVYLMGRVTQKEAARATDVARSIDGVKKVVRVLEIISEDELQRLQTP
jgi:osmotically-inducible protein OsmY